MTAIGDNAMITLTRAAGGWRDLLRSYRVVIDGKAVAKVKRGQTVELPVVPGRHAVFLKIDWAQSAVLEVDVPAGDVVKLFCEPGGPASAGLASVVGDAARDYIRLTRARE